MRRYFFNLADEAYPLDLQGVELLCVADIELEAVRFAKEVSEDRPELIPADGNLQVEITDAVGTLLFALVAIAIPTTLANPTRKSLSCATLHL